MSDSEITNILFTPVEARILGCLIEKQATTPETYPLTLNALVTACNQKTSREPVMNLDPGEVGQALRALDNRRLVSRTISSRADRWEHKVDRVLELPPGSLALIGLLLLRGPQTINELLTRSSRMHAFNDTEQLIYQLERLIPRGLVVKLPRQPGQREERYMHLMCGPIDAAALSLAASLSSDKSAAIDPQQINEQNSKIEELEAKIADLEQRLVRLESALL